MLEWKKVELGVYSAQGAKSSFLVRNEHQEIGGAPLWAVTVDGTESGTVYRWLSTAFAVAERIEEGRSFLRYH